jgi:hypothetical protein
MSCGCICVILYIKVTTISSRQFPSRRRPATFSKMEKRYSHIFNAEYVVLSNSGSQKYFPGNTGQSFVNILTRQLPFSGKGILQVALLDVYYNPSQPEPKTTIFGHEPGDNDINIIFMDKVLKITHKKGDALDNFVSHANESCTSNSLDISFSVDSSKDNKYLVVKNNEIDRKITLAGKFSSVFGFEDAVLHKGVHKAKNIVTAGEFEKIETGTFIIISPLEQPLLSIKVEEPPEKTVTALVSCMNTALSSLNTKFSYNEKSLTFEALNEKDLILQLSPFLTRKFQIADGHWFGNKKEVIYLSSHIKFPLGLPERVLVECDVVEPYQQANGQLRPVLKMFESKYTGMPIQYAFDTPQFLPVTLMPRPIQNISIKLLDEHFEPIKLQPGSTTTAVLQFREVQ